MTSNLPFQEWTGSSARNQSQNLEEEIRQRAYELYEEQDREDGHDLNDWLRAEAEIVQRKSGSVLLGHYR